MSKADDRFFLRTAHARLQSRLGELKAQPTPWTPEHREAINGRVEALQFMERELEALDKV